MPNGDAYRLTNFVVDTDGVRLRNGYAQFVSLGVTAPIDFLKKFDTPGGQRLYAAASGKIFDITNGSANQMSTGGARSDWRSAAMNGRLGMVNGGDQPIYITHNASMGTTSQINNMEITGPPNPELLKVIHVYKSRSYFATGDQTGFWYSAVGALGGTLTFFPLDRVSRTGGNVVEISSWTVDGGEGTDDFLVIFLGSGEVLVYQGSNPSDATDFSIVGRYSVGRVITAEQFAGQIHAVTANDYNVLPRDFQTQGIAPQSKLSGAAKTAVKDKGGLERWQIVFVPHLGLRIVNVPQSVSQYHQHVVNINNGAPTLWTGLNATRWEVFGTALYFGDTAGKVNVYSGTSDNGTAISWEIATAPHRLGSDLCKTVHEYRSIISCDGTITETSGLGFDYEPPTFAQDVTTNALGTPWNTSPWNTSSWSGNQQRRGEWVGGLGSGQAVQFFSRGSVKGFTPIWRGIDFSFDLEDVH